MRLKRRKSADQKNGFRQNAVLGLAYCTSKQVRKNAVIKYLEDLWNEQGNEFVKYFCTDLSNNKVSSIYKKSMLNDVMFEELLLEVVNNNSFDVRN